MVSSTMEEDEVNLDSTSENILRPEPPAPTASNEDVQQYLTQFFRALRSRRTIREARILAERIDADGAHLYEIPPKRWYDEFGHEGDAIYSALKRTKYGIEGSYWARIGVVAATLAFTGAVEGFVELAWDKDARIFIFPIICTVLTISLGVINLYCRTQSAHDNEWIPEGFKIRQ